jgi:hypothetical protein
MTCEDSRKCTGLCMNMAIQEHPRIILLAIIIKMRAWKWHFDNDGHASSMNAFWLRMPKSRENKKKKSFDPHLKDLALWNTKRSRFSRKTRFFAGPETQSGSQGGHLCFFFRIYTQTQTGLLRQNVFDHISRQNYFEKDFKSRRWKSPGSPAESAEESWGNLPGSWTMYGSSMKGRFSESTSNFDHCKVNHLGFTVNDGWCFLLRSRVFSEMTRLDCLQDWRTSWRWPSTFQTIPRSRWNGCL